MAEKGSKTVLHGGFTESIKNIPKTVKLTENRHSEGDGYTLKRGK